MRLITTLFALHLMLCSFSQQKETDTKERVLPDSIIFKKGIDLALKHKYDSAKSLLIYSADSSSISLFEKGKSNYHLRTVYRSSQEYQKAFQRAEQAIKIFEQLEDHHWLGFSNYNLCMDNLIAGSYDVALIQAQKAFDAFQHISDTTMMIESMVRRGIVFHDIEEFEEGIRVCNQADQLREIFSGKNADLQVSIWGIIAINYDDMGRSDKAVEMYKKILPLKDELSSERPITRTYNNMGNSLMKLGRLDEAEKYLLLNLVINEKNQNQYGIATVKTNLGTIAYKKGRFKKAEELLNEAERIAFEINDAEKILDVLQQKYLMREAQGNPSIALSYLKKYHSTKDSLYSLDKQRQIRLLETQFETHKKEQQIALQNSLLSEQKAEIKQKQTFLIASLTVTVLIILVGLLLRNRLQKKQKIRLQEAEIKNREAEINATISSQENERARYARDLHDGFGQMISILNMNLKNLQNGANPDERQKVFEASEKVIDEMYDELKNICFDLMPQTLIKHGLESALKEFTNRINQAGKIFIELNVFGIDERLTELQEISLYRISQEWVNNILKYADATKVTLQITKDEDEITLLIEDDGMGFDPSLLSSGKGNGWKNLNTRAKLIQGELELETQPGKKGNVLIVNARLDAKIYNQKFELLA